MTDIIKHIALRALRKLYEASLSVERLPSSSELTAAACLIEDASRSVDALVNEVNRIQNVAIMSDFIFMAAQELREAVEPFRCDTFGCETTQSERLDKACAALDRVRGNGLLKAAKETQGVASMRALLVKACVDFAHMGISLDDIATKFNIRLRFDGNRTFEEDTTK